MNEILKKRADILHQIEADKERLQVGKFGQVSASLSATSFANLGDRLLVMNARAVRAGVLPNHCGQCGRERHPDSLVHDFCRPGLYCPVVGGMFCEGEIYGVTSDSSWVSLDDGQPSDRRQDEFLEAKLRVHLEEYPESDGTLAIGSVILPNPTGGWFLVWDFSYPNEPPVMRNVWGSADTLAGAKVMLVDDMVRSFGEVSRASAGERAYVQGREALRILQMAQMW